MGEGKAYECLDNEEVIKDLNTNLETGLSEAEAKKRLNEYGENVLKEKKKDGPFKIFLSQLMDPMIYVLFAAIAVTIGVSIYETVKVIKEGGAFDFFSTGDWPDVIIILVVILMNAFIGTIQELKAQTSLEALKKMSSPESTVIRDGKRFKVKSSNLVPGDVVVIEEGDTIGADLRLIEAVNLKVNESSLTGESVPVEKDSNVVFTDKVALGDKVNSCFMSTTVAYGRGIGVVARTGMNTETEEMTPLQKVLANLSKILGLITLAVVALVLIVEIIWIFVDGKGSAVEAYIEAVLSAISLAVAAIPEGLAAVVTIVLSLGVQRMVKANTIVRKLPSVETLGSVSVVCSDKTGTLTQNKMTVLEAYVPGKLYVRDDFKEGHTDSNLTLLATGMSLCSNATVDEGLYGDPTEIALVVFANDFNLHKKNLEESYPRVEELPFDSVRKLMSTRHEHEGKSIVFTKGALDSLYNEIKFSDLELMEERSGKEQKQLDKFFVGKPVYDAIIADLKSAVSDRVWLSLTDFMPTLTKTLANATTDKKLLDKIADGLSVMDKSAEIQRDKKGNIIFDKETKDTEIVKFDESIEDYMAREVLPHVPDAQWFFEEDLGKKNPVVKTGAEIPFTRYFYKYQQPKPSEELEQRFLELEKSVSERIARLFG